MRPSVVYVVPDKMGGMMNIIANLLAHRRPDALEYHAVLTHNHLHMDLRFARPRGGPLRLVFAGRFEQQQKGIFDLPEIDRALSAQGVVVEWTIAGAGPDELELKRRWAFNPDVRWMGALSNDAVIALYATED